MSYCWSQKKFDNFSDFFFNSGFGIFSYKMRCLFLWLKIIFYVLFIENWTPQILFIAHPTGNATFVGRKSAWEAMGACLCEAFFTGAICNGEWFFLLCSDKMYRHFFLLIVCEYQNLVKQKFELITHKKKTVKSKIFSFAGFRVPDFWI